MDIVEVKLQVEAIEGFSGHSDRRQIINYITHLQPKPERVIICHGEKAKCMSMANFLYQRFGVPTIVPSVLETIRLL
jgi:predicted metal-dependent RNase